MNVSNPLTRNRKQNHRLLMFVLLILFVLVNCFFVEGHAYFNPGNRVPMTSLEYGLSLGTILVYDALFYLLAFLFYRPKTNWPILIGLGVLFLINLVALSFFPGIYDTGDLVYWPTAGERVRSFFDCLVLVLSLYGLLVVGPQVVQDGDLFDLFFVYITINALAAILYSYATEGSLYLQILPSGPVDAYSVPQSFTSHRNIYAALLLYGMMGQAYLQCKHPFWWRWVLILFFFVNQYFILSKTCILLCCLFLGAFAVYRMVKTFAKHKVRNGIALGLFTAGILVALIIAFGTDTPLVQPLQSFLKTIFSSIGDSWETRVFNWSDILRKLFESPVTMLFGFGVTLSRQSLLVAVYSEEARLYTPVDNSIVCLWSNFGLLGVILYGAFLVYLFYWVYRAFKAKQRTAVVSLMILLILIGHGITEDTNFLSFVSTGVVALFSAVMPLITPQYEKSYAEERKPPLEKAKTRRLEKPEKPELTTSEYTTIWVKILTPLFALLLGVSKLLQVQLPERFHFAYGNPAWEMTMGLAFLVVPFLLSALRELRKKKSWLPYSALVGGLALSLVFAFVGPWKGFEWVFAGISMGLLALSMGAAIFFKVGLPYRVYAKTLALPLLYLFFVLSVNLGLTYGLSGSMSRYLCLVFVALDVLLWICCLYWPFPKEKWAEGRYGEYLEDKFTFLLIEGRLKEDERLSKRELQKK
jgi:hypothetical protein